MKLKNPSSVGLAFISVGFAMVFIYGVLFSVCTSGGCSPNGLVLAGVVFSLGNTMILSGAILAAAGYIAEHIPAKSSS